MDLPSLSVHLSGDGRILPEAAGRDVGQVEPALIQLDIALWTLLAEHADIGSEQFRLRLERVLAACGQGLSEGGRVELRRHAMALLARAGLSGSAFPRAPSGA
ncbi:hypothetical protein [Xanthomonas massiliensis]|uniref:hypothetical protein n=1 Tax=Xanthomonas massiliensis TaxID=1720302 RepID=UPI000A92115D|nr:hypothetical protein [Xanthomonas massiliensis]